jgi:hypothetical protein
MEKIGVYPNLYFILIYIYKNGGKKREREAQKDMV